MKIRTDFVTNSSSSSFVTVSIVTRSGIEYELELSENAYVVESALPEVEGNTLVYRDDEKKHTVSTVLELLSCIYFSQIESCETVPFDVSCAIFAFLLGKLSCKKLFARLKKCDLFEELEDFDPDDFDDESEAREALLETLSEVFEEVYSYIDLEDESSFEMYRGILDSVSSLSELKKVEICQSESNWDEFMESYSERLADCLSNRTFVAVATDDPSYQTQYEFWLGVLKNKVFHGCESLDESFESLVKKALASGEPFDMMPSSVLDKSNVATIEIPEGLVCSSPSKTGSGSVFQCDDVNEIAFEGKTFVLTGHSEKQEAEITAIIEERGGEVKSSTVLKTDYLIVNEDYDKPATTKYKRALELKEKGKNIRILDAKRFFELSGFLWVGNKKFLEKTTFSLVSPANSSQAQPKPCRFLTLVPTEYKMVTMYLYLCWLETLEEVVLEEGITSIGARSFSGCKKLSKVKIPASVTAIQNDAFQDSPNVTIHAPAGSYAEEWAKKRDIPFKAI